MGGVFKVCTVETLRQENICEKQIIILANNKVEYLGYLIDRGQIRADPSQVATITKWPTHTCMKYIQYFLGLTNFL